MTDYEARLRRLEQLVAQATVQLNQALPQAITQTQQVLQMLLGATFTGGPQGIASITVRVGGCGEYAINNVPVTFTETGQTLTPTLGTNSVTFDVPFTPSATPQNIDFSFSADPTGIASALRFQPTAQTNTLQIPVNATTFEGNITLVLSPRPGFHCCNLMPIGQPLSDTLFLQDAIYGQSQIDWSDAYSPGILGIRDAWFACASGDFSSNSFTFGNEGNISWLYILTTGGVSLGVTSFFQQTTIADGTIGGGPIKDDTCDDLYTTYSQPAWGNNTTYPNPNAYGIATVPFQQYTAPDDPTLAPDPRFELTFWFTLAPPSTLEAVPWVKNNGTDMVQPLLTVKEVS